MEQVDEQQVAKSISNFNLWLAQDEIVRVEFCCSVEQLAVSPKGERIDFSAGAMNNLRCDNRPRADIPGDSQRCIHNIITWYQVHYRVTVATHRSEQAFREASKKPNVTVIG